MTRAEKREMIFRGRGRQILSLCYGHWQNLTQPPDFLIVTAGKSGIIPFYDPAGAVFNRIAEKIKGCVLYEAEDYPAGVVRCVWLWQENLFLVWDRDGKCESFCDLSPFYRRDIQAEDKYNPAELNRLADYFFLRAEYMGKTAF